MSKSRIWTGRIMFAIVVLFMAFDGIIHLTHIPAVVEGFNAVGFPISVALPLGIIELICLLLYIIPSTSVLGAILLTGYLGGAVAANVRIEAPLFGNILFPVYIGILLWGALYFLENRVSALLPFKNK